MNKTLNQKFVSLFKNRLIEKIHSGLLPPFDVIFKELVLLTGLQGENHEIETLSWYESLFSLTYLEKYFSSPHDEIILHGHDCVEVHGRGQKTILPIEHISKEDFITSLKILAMKNQIVWNHSRPFVSFSASVNGHCYRIGLLHSSLSPVNRTKAFLRKLEKDTFPLASFAESEEQVDFLVDLIIKKKNIVIAGSTGSGKTSFLKSLVTFIPPGEHLIFLEDTHELYNDRPNSTFLLAQQQENKSLKDYCHYSLRMSPDRMVLGELRSEEIVPFTLAMNTGHQGLLTTIHANNSVDAISRMGMLFSLYNGGSQGPGYELILDLIAKNVDYVVFLVDKKIHHINRIVGSSGGKILSEMIISSRQKLSMNS